MPKLDYRLPFDIYHYGLPRLDADHPPLPRLPDGTPNPAWLAVRNCGPAALKSACVSLLRWQGVDETISGQSVDSIADEIRAPGYLTPPARRQPDGSGYLDGIGWIHRALAQWAGEKGLAAECASGQTVDDLLGRLDRQEIPIVSVRKNFHNPDPDNRGRGGHLVLLYGHTWRGNGSSVFYDDSYEPRIKDGAVADGTQVGADLLASSFTGNAVYIRIAPD